MGTYPLDLSLLQACHHAGFLLAWIKFVVDLLVIDANDAWLALAVLVNFDDLVFLAKEHEAETLKQRHERKSNLVGNGRKLVEHVVEVKVCEVGIASTGPPP